MLLLFGDKTDRGQCMPTASQRPWAELKFRPRKVWLSCSLQVSDGEGAPGFVSCLWSSQQHRAVAWRRGWVRQWWIHYKRCPKHVSDGWEGVPSRWSSERTGQDTPDVVGCDHLLKAGACHVPRGSGQGAPGRSGQASPSRELCREICRVGGRRVGRASLAKETVCAKAGRLRGWGWLVKLLIIVSPEHQLQEDWTEVGRRGARETEAWPGRASVSCKGV